MRIEYQDNETFMGDKRHLIKCDPDSDLRSTSDYTLHIEELVKEIEENGHIKTVHYWLNDDLKLSPPINNNDKFIPLSLEEGV